VFRVLSTSPFFFTRKLMGYIQELIATQLLSDSVEVPVLILSSV
jgi:hypothetical protein